MNSSIEFTLFWGFVLRMLFSHYINSETPSISVKKLTEKREKTPKSASIETNFKARRNFISFV